MPRTLDSKSKEWGFKSLLARQRKGGMMTIKQLIEKYVKLHNKNYETILITQVINDLRQISRGRQ